MFEREYIKWHKGKQLSIHYDGGYTWATWLEGTGNTACGWNADETLDNTNAKLGTSYTVRDFMSFHNGKRTI